MTLRINRIETPALAAWDIHIVSAIRRNRVVICEANTFPIERIFVEFERESLATAFQRSLEEGTSVIKIDPDSSIDAVPAKLQRKYFSLKKSGHTVRLTELMNELWEDYGVDPECTAVRETSGIRRIAIMHDDGVSSCGFRGKKRELRRWMFAHGFTAARDRIEDF